jgi:hypothetical protein
MAVTGTGSGTVSDLNDLALRLNDPAFLAKMKSDPHEALASVAPPGVLQTDPVVYRIVVLSLGLTVILSVIGFIILSFDGKVASEGLVAIGSAAVGAIAGLLAPSPGGSK